MKYAVEMDSGVEKLVSRFINIEYGIQEFIGEGYQDIQKALCSYFLLPFVPK
jgi:hypothetical protein